MSMMEQFVNAEVISERGNRQTVRSGDLVLKRFLDPDPLDRGRVQDRGRALQTLIHPGLAQCVDVLEDEDSIALVYRWVEGETVAEMIDRSHRWTESELYEFIIQCCDAMWVAHSASPPIVHRDIKPHNVVWTGDRFVIIDFDAAREFVDSVGNVSVIGTTGYAAPEQFVGRASVQSDQYGIATSVVHMASHRHPTDFPLTKLRLDLTTLAVGDALRSILNKMLDPTETDRFEDLPTLKSAVKRGSALTPAQQALEPLTTFDGIVTMSETDLAHHFEIGRRFRPALFSAAVLGTLAGVIGVAFTLHFAPLFVVALFGAFAYQEFRHLERSKISVTNDGWEVETSLLGYKKLYVGKDRPNLEFQRPRLGRRIASLAASRLHIEFDSLDTYPFKLQSGFLPIEAESLVMALWEAFDAHGLGQDD